MQKTKLLPYLLAMLSASCATTGPSSPELPTQVRIVDTGCDWTRPIYIAREDVLTDSTARTILTHNQTGARLCGWKPKNSAK